MNRLAILAAFAAYTSAVVLETDLEVSADAEAEQCGNSACCTSADICDCVVAELYS